MRSALLGPDPELFSPVLWGAPVDGRGQEEPGMGGSPSWRCPDPALGKIESFPGQAGSRSSRGLLSERLVSAP